MRPRHPQVTECGVSRCLHKLQEALDKAAKDPGVIQQRAHDVMNAVALVMPMELKGALLDQYERIRNLATVVDPEKLDIKPEGAGKFQVTCMSMSIDEAVSVLDQLLGLRDGLEHELRSLEQENGETGG